MRICLTAVTDHGPIELLVVADAHHDIGQLRAAIATALSTTSTGLWVAGVRLDDATPLRATPLSNGGRVYVTVPPTSTHAGPTSTAIWNASIVSGPDSGVILPLHIGSNELG